jgi:transcriptional regulator of met regulon
VWTNMSDNVSEMICDLYRASTEYNIVGLKRNCEQTLASQISIHSACDILIVSDECGGANLHNICLKYISMNTEAVMMTEGFRKLNANLCRKVLGEVSNNAEKVQKQRSNTDHSVLSSMDESSSSNNFTPQEFQNRDDLRKKMNSGPHEMDNNDEKFKKTNNFNAQEDLHDGNDDNQNNNFAPLKFYDTEDSKINM